MNRPTRRLLAAITCVALVAVGVGTTGVDGASAIGTTRFVATTGSDTANTCLVSAAPCLTFGHALTQAVAGDTIELQPGTYHETDNPAGTANAVPAALHDLTIQSNPVGGSHGNTIIDATGEANALVINADGVTVRKLAFRNADREGIVVSPPDDAATPAAISDVTLGENDVLTNDQCANHPTAADCPAQNGARLPWGWGIRLTSVTDSLVTQNTVDGNWGGIHVDDTLGPSHGNVISENGVEHNGVEHNGKAAIGDANIEAAGISLEGDSRVARSSAGAREPALGGVYANSVDANSVTSNASAGIALDAFSAFNAVYANRVTRNVVADNGSAGIAIKSLAAQQDLNDNTISGSSMYRNDMTGGVAGGPGDVDAGATHTAAILVFSASGPLTGTAVTANTGASTYYGVWMSLHTPREDVSANNMAVDTGGALIHVARTAAPVVGIARTTSGHGYWQVQSDGTVFPFGVTDWYGSLGGTPLAGPIVGIAANSSGSGYWLAGADGGVYSFGDTRFYGSAHPAHPIVGITASPGDLGYWLVASDGGVFSFGSAVFRGSAGGIHLNQPIVGMALGHDGGGYWLVASDGGVFSYGNAAFHGSTGAIHVNRPVVGITAGPSSDGYWLVASDGGIFSFGSAAFHGSTGAIQLRSPVNAMTATPTDGGYWLAASDGGIFAFPDARYWGSVSANPAG